MTGPDDRLQQAHDLVEAAVFEAVEGAGRDPLPDWRVSLRHVAYELNRIANHRYAHPDDVLRARTAMESLAAVWLTGDEIEALTADLYPELKDQP